jgi:hypothetical protein
MRLSVLFLLLVLVGCESKPTLTEISGTVTFKGQPIPAGDVSFTPEVSVAGGQLQMYMVKDGKYDSTQTPEMGLLPGKYKVRINGYDGKQIPNFYSGKQIFNTVEEQIEITAGKMTKDFVVPDAAGQNIKYVETADF